MIYRRHVPRPPLSEFIELLWLFENAAPSHESERVLPTGTVELVINLHQRTGSFDALVAGPHSRFFILDTNRPAAVIGVHFKPSGAFPFLALPVDELRNRHVSLEALWGGRATQLRERLLAAEEQRRGSCCWSVPCCPCCSDRIRVMPLSAMRWLRFVEARAASPTWSMRPASVRAASFACSATKSG